MAVFYSLDHALSFQSTLSRFTMGIVHKKQKNGNKYYQKNSTAHRLRSLLFPPVYAAYEKPGLLQAG